jgi:hypothetical protein
MGISNSMHQTRRLACCLQTRCRVRSRAVSVVRLVGLLEETRIDHDVTVNACYGYDKGTAWYRTIASNTINSLGRSDFLNASDATFAKNGIACGCG